MRFVAERCPRCFLKSTACLCPALPRVVTSTRFLLLRHYRERDRPSNSGRIAALALPNARLVEYGALGVPLPEAELADPASWVLYPAPPPPPPGAPPPEQLVVLDGSWPQARKMLQRVPALRRMPRLSLPPLAVAPSRRLRLRRLPHELSTLEAIAAAVALLEGEALARPLFDLFALFVERTDPPRR
ncbi:MAG: DTW domain-containing protein [Planctomycetes bacterium]|nr:DTW domain-containing protein [Planctomycetota bacterium]